MSAEARVRDPDAPLTVIHVDTERGWRGGERQALWLADGLARAGHRSFVAARPSEPLAQRARGRALPVLPCDPIGEFDLLAALRLRRAVRTLRADVIHAHTAHALALAALAASRTSVRVVASRRVDFHLRRNAATRWKYGRADAVIAISEAVRQVLLDDGLPPSRVTVIPSGVPPASGPGAELRRVPSPASAETLQAIGVPPGAPVVVQVSQLVGHKDPLNFVRAIAAARRTVPTVHGVLVGDGPLREAVAQEVARLGVADAVHLTGYRQDADSLLAAADVVTLSSREEGMGSVLLDALVLGRPIVATRAGGIPEVVEDGVSGLLAPVEDGEALGALLARVLADDALRRALAEGAAARAEHFSIARTVDRTLAVYRQVLAAPPRRRLRRRER